ncbi:capsular polysaccharide export protein, LipB/KpsS family [Pseudoalteromonas gelatinilytica]|uniref:Capsular biosynthesis protein n=1 Tax=Pseudoalteromonas gelatinilytica TaxID=1703256 RepID=A0A3A3EK78_9GAMM|nr:hypothetical protein [Pseudoalteromonas profundi]RJF34624.1 hypothetical protein D4741_14685 [Pseudoalteromonas profundi]
MYLTSISINDLPDSYVIVGTGRFTESFLKLLENTTLPRPHVILDLNTPRHNDKQYGIPVLGFEQYDSNLSENIVLGSDVYQVQLIDKFNAHFNTLVSFIDVSNDVQVFNNKTHCFNHLKEITSDYVLFFSVGSKFPLTKWLGNFYQWLNIQGVHLVSRHPMEYVSEEELKSAKAIILWNGETPHFLSLKSKISSLGLLVTYSECGHFPQHENYYFDKRGVNFNSQLLHDDLSWVDTHDYKVMKTVREHFFKGYKGKNEGYVFVPLQIESDSNLQNYSRFKSGMQEFIDFIEKLYPQKKLIFKAHPKDMYKNKYRFNHGILSNLDTKELIVNSSFVHGINSGVLFEAVLFGKKVIAEGECLLNHKAATMEDVVAAMLSRQKNIKDTRFNAEYLDRFTNFTGIR